MSIFDRMTDEELQRRLAQPEMGTNYGPAMQQGQARPQTMETYGAQMNTGPQMPKVPSYGKSDMDVSGFANYGMQAPQLEGPMTQLAGLMAINDKANQPQQQQQKPAGGLMAYLLSLGA